MIVYLQMIETDEDKSKFEEIYQEYRNLMYYVAYKRMQHEQDAEDVVHHVFVKIAENIKNIEPVSPKVSVKPRHVKRPPSQGELLLTKMAVSLRIYVLRLQSNLIAHRHT